MGVVSDVRSHLVSEGLVEGSTGWTCTRRRVHDATDQLVVITEDGGAPPTGVHAASGVGSAVLEDPAAQVLVRGAAWDADASYDKAEAIREELDGASGSVGSGSYHRIIAQTSEPLFVGYDESGRPQHTISFRFLTDAS